MIFGFRNIESLWQTEGNWQGAAAVHRPAALHANASSSLVTADRQGLKESSMAGEKPQPPHMHLGHCLSHELRARLLPCSPAPIGCCLVCESSQLSQWHSELGSSTATSLKPHPHRGPLPSPCAIFLAPKAKNSTLKGWHSHYLHLMEKEHVLHLAPKASLLNSTGTFSSIHSQWQVWACLGIRPNRIHEDLRPSPDLPSFTELWVA